MSHPAPCVRALFALATTLALALPASFQLAHAAPGVECDIVLAVTETSPLGSLKYELDYSSSPGGIVGSGNTPDCTGLVNNGLSAFTDNDDSELLTGGFLSLTGAATPASIAKCVFRGSETPGADAFHIEVTEAFDINVEPVEPLPQVTIANIECVPLEASTTTSTTITTTTTVGIPPLQCGNWQIEIALDTAPEDVGALLLRVDFGAAAGSFVGDDSEVLCTGPEGDFNFAATEFLADAELLLGIIAVDGIEAGTVVAACIFSGTWSDPPEAADFVVHVEEATDVDGELLEVAVSSSLSALTGPDDCEDRCGDGVIAEAEQCDDANTSGDDSCTSACNAATCSDGFVHAGFEACDDANTNNTDGCLNTCDAASCGDGIVHDGVEACDDGNQSNTDDCVDACVLAACGDGYRHAGSELCEDGNTTGGDGCSPRCHLEQGCGDAVPDGQVSVSDALRALQSAVGIEVDCATWVCDVNGDRSVTAIDALSILRRSVGLEVVLDCNSPTKLNLRVESSGFLGRLELVVDYSNAAGAPSGSGSSAMCATDLPFAITTVFNNTATKSLKVTLGRYTGSGFQTPITAFRCDFVPTGTVTRDDFNVLVKASDQYGLPVTGVVAVAIPD